MIDDYLPRLLEQPRVLRYGGFFVSFKLGAAFLTVADSTSKIVKLQEALRIPVP